MNKRNFTDREKVEEYRACNFINSSTLKNLEHGVDRYKDSLETVLDSLSLTIGSIVDTLLTDKEGSFEEQYIILSDSITIPTEKKLDIILKLYELAKEQGEVQSDITAYVDILISILENTDWYSNRKLTTRVEDIYNHADYFSFLVAAEGKKIITSSTYNKAKEVVDSLLLNEHTAKYFLEEAIPTGICIFYQIPIYFKLNVFGVIEEVDAKALLDFVVVDTVNKVIIPGDLKTMSNSCINFKSNVLNYRYDIQAAFYLEALRYILKTNSNIFGIDLTEYTLQTDFRFIVESTKYVGNPIEYRCDETVIGAGLYGQKSADGKYVYSKGYKELVEEFVFLQRIDFRRDKIVEENKGVLTLSL